MASIQPPNAAAGQGTAAPRTFSEMLAESRWKTITVRHVIVRDGVGQTFPWEFGPPRASTECPASERWELSLTPHVTGPSPVTVRMDVQIRPTPPPGAAPDTMPVPPGCGAQTTLVVRDQELIVLSGFPAPADAKVGLTTTVTPYVIWEDADLRRLLECKGKHTPTNVDVVRSIPPQTPDAGTQ